MTKAVAGPVRRGLLFWIVLAAAIFVGANAHLLYVAVQSDPGCIPHLKEPGSAAGQYRAAKSSC
ncbi:hypothetical protein QN219_14550 [Sinorhizobium sp. 7-81]|uniref:hypothetical protein n=1 Tax=Sinorhizobium sp. 8-89 TaxID=3049089 RepID=UPI0024C43EC0|nr:hypothetical protein [Sinorhizobium sp. 8-89]MDK1491268.1 hypothetical protein [Sinorhizobium sp. 8-89]